MCIGAFKCAFKIPARDRNVSRRRTKRVDITRQGFEKQVVGWCGARVDGGRNNERGGEV